MEHGPNGLYTKDRLMTRVGKLAAEKGAEVSLSSLEDPRRKRARPETQKNDQQTAI